MELNNNLNAKVKLVGMNNVDISTLEKPIIGTNGLATCVGVLLYNEDKKVAIVAHLSSEWKETLEEMFKLISKYKLDSSAIKYTVISGYYPNHYNIKEKVEDAFESVYPIFIPFDKNEIGNKAIEVVEEISEKRFVFDSISGKFVTELIDFDQVVDTNEYQNKRK